MAEYSRFFNSVDGDNLYQASDFAEYFSTFLSDGIFSEDGKLGLKVSENQGMSVKVATGYAFIRGYMYKNDSPLFFTLDHADSMFDRIDRIVLRFDELERRIGVIVKKGTPASNPLVPTLESTDTVDEFSLARIKIPKNSTSIVQEIITDERYNEEVCGIVSSLITIPISDMLEQWNRWLEDRQNEIGVRIVTGTTPPGGLAAGDIWFQEFL